MNYKIKILIPNKNNSFFFDVFGFNIISVLYAPGPGIFYYIILIEKIFFIYLIQYIQN